MTISPSSGYREAKWIVSPTAGQGTHTTIAAALTAASSGDTIFIREGTYTENPTLKAGVNLQGWSASGLNQAVIINGKCTFTAAGSVSISGLTLQTNSDYLLAVTGSANSVVNLFNCQLTISNNTAISYTSSGSGSGVLLYSCNGSINTTGITLFVATGSGSMLLQNCIFLNGGSSTTASSTSSCAIFVYNSQFNNAFSTSSTGNFLFYDSQIFAGAINTAALTTAGTGTSLLTNCYLSSGTASVISAGAGTTVQIYTSAVNSSNTNVFTGAGTLDYGDITFSGSSSGVNTTTVNPIAFPVPQGGTGATTLTGLVLGSGTSAMTAVTYTAVSSWTPGIAFGGGTTGITYTIQSGYYQQIGSIVFFNFRIALSSKGSSSGTAKITGFPVSTGANGQINGGFCVWSQMSLGSYTAVGYEMDANATTASLLICIQSGGFNTVSDTQCTNTTQLIASGIYLTN